MLMALEVLAIVICLYPCPPSIKYLMWPDNNCLTQNISCKTITKMPLSPSIVSILNFQHKIVCPRKLDHNAYLPGIPYFFQLE